MGIKTRKAVERNPNTMWRKCSHYSTELKLFFIIFFILCSIATLFQFLPTYLFPSCPTTYLTITTSNTTTITETSTTPSPPQQPTDQILENGTIRRTFYPVGTAAYNFVFMSAYRGGPNTFAIMGLSSKPLHNFGHPTYTCEYQYNNGTSFQVTGKKLEFQDFGYARVYLVVVVNCTFPYGTSDDPSNGGRLLLHASSNGGYDQAVNSTDTIVVLNESQNTWEASQFVSPPKYDYLYCGGSLFGELSPQRMREWIAYHVRLFGKRSHFVIHDAGGVHEEVMEVLKPWIEQGYVSVEDIREQERFDGFYHNQMLVLNDCLHRYRFETKWMFFFDVDEYIYLGEKNSFQGLMESLKGYTMFIIEQVSMSNRLCLAQDSPEFSKKWGFEKLVYKNGKKARRDHKYAIQPRNVFATGVHKSENFVGKSTQLPNDLIKYFHFHGTVAERREPCRQLLKGASTTMERTPYVLDTTLRSLAPLVKQFELDTIGSRLQSTRL